MQRLQHQRDIKVLQREINRHHGRVMTFQQFIKVAAENHQQTVTLVVYRQLLGANNHLTNKTRLLQTGAKTVGIRSCQQKQFHISPLCIRRNFIY
jgi:hypothetical protein